MNSKFYWCFLWYDSYIRMVEKKQKAASIQPELILVVQRRVAPRPPRIKFTNTYLYA